MKLTFINDHLDPVFIFIFRNSPYGCLSPTDLPTLWFKPFTITCCNSHNWVPYYLWQLFILIPQKRDRICRNVNEDRMVQIGGKSIPWNARDSHLRKLPPVPKEDLYNMVMETLLTGHSHQICHLNWSYPDVMLLDKCVELIRLDFDFHFFHDQLWGVGQVI